MEDPDLIKELVLIALALAFYSAFTYVFVNGLVRFMIWLEDVERRRKP